MPPAGHPDGQHHFYELIQFLSGYLATASSGSGLSLQMGFINHRVMLLCWCRSLSTESDNGRIRISVVELNWMKCSENEDEFENAEMKLFGKNSNSYDLYENCCRFLYYRHRLYWGWSNRLLSCFYLKTLYQFNLIHFYLYRPISQYNRLIGLYTSNFTEAWRSAKN